MPRTTPRRPARTTPGHGMRTFVHILVNTAVANLATSFLWFGLTFWIYAETRNVIASGAVGAAYMLFVSVCSMLFGTLVDRFDKKAVMVWATVFALGMFLIDLAFFAVAGADRLATVLGGVFNTFPYSAFAQNVGLVALSRIASRFVVTAAGIILIILGLLPKMGAVATGIPSQVLGGAGVALFGMVASSGIRTLSTVVWNETRALIVGVSIAVAMLPSVLPGMYEKLPEELEMILDSGISAGAITVIVLNLLLNRTGGGHLAPALEGKKTEGPEETDGSGPTGDSESTSVVLNNAERAAVWAQSKAEDARTAVAEARAAAAKAEEIRAAEERKQE